MTQVHTLIEAGWIVPVDPDNIVYQQHSLVIKNGKIVDLLDSEQARKKYQALEIHSLPQHVLLPGFVNAHTHAPMTLMRGLADDLPLMEWLENHIWPCEKKWVNESFVKDGTDLAIAEMLLGGTTCFNDMYFFPEITAHQAISHGIRATIGLIVLDFPTAYAQNSDEYIEKALELHQKFRHQPLISTAFAPHAPYTVSDEPLTKIKTLADQLNIPIHIHVHETANEILQHKQQYGKTPLKRLNDLGLLNPNLIAVHMTQLTDDEIKHYAATGAHIVHCPESNLKLASGFCPVTLCLNASINVALGTDGAASNNDLDMFTEMRTAALLAKGITGNASSVPAHTALKMATLNGAKALGLDDKIGSLTVGKAADIIAVDLDCLETLPMYDVISHLVYACSRSQVTDVWVQGKHLLNNRQLTTLDVNVLKKRLQLWQQRLSS